MEKDLQAKNYLSDPERFADLINGVVGLGRQLITPADLYDADTGLLSSVTPYTHNHGKKKQFRQQYRDMVKKAAFGINFMVIGIENQESVHYLMPLRCMLYDGREYERQAVKIRRQTKKRKDISSPEFLSGFTKNDRLKPCVTFVLYYGNNWDGPRDLHQLLDFSDIPSELQKFINNYQIFICEIRRWEHTEFFKTDLKQVFDCIRYSEDKEKLYELVTTDPAYQNLSEDTFDIITEYTKSMELMIIKDDNKKGGNINMCRAITELIQDGKLEGMEQGIRQGIEKGGKALIEASRELGIGHDEIFGILMQKLQLSEEKAEEFMEKYWH